jgi:D-glycero-alpha-D-manno-heptose-7-phosphate kinase
MVLESKAPVRIDFAGAWTDCAPFYIPFGGATLNASINQYVSGSLVTGKDVPLPSREGIGVTYLTDIPAGSGLGTSATLNVVWLSLARARPLASQQEKEAIAASAYDIEKVLGIIGGKQDQYASAVGGINLFTFTEEGVTTTKVELPPPQIKQLESLLVLCYTGESRLSSNIHQNVWGNFRAGKRDTVDALFTLRDSAYAGKEILEQAQLDRLGPLLTRQFDCMKHLDASTTNDTLEAIFALVAGETSGGKPCGAGGGGCLLFCAREPNLKPVIEEKIRTAGYRVIDFEFEFEGLQITLRP